MSGDNPLKFPTTVVFEFPDTLVGVTLSVLVKLPSEVPQLKTIDVVVLAFAFTVPFKVAEVVVTLVAD